MDWWSRRSRAARIGIVLAVVVGLVIITIASLRL